MIQYASEKDLSKIAACHILAFPDSVTSLLGKKVVESMLKWYLSGTNKFLFFIEEGGKVSGYCGGHLKDGTDPYGSSSGMSQFGFNSALSAFLKKPWLLFHPEVRKKYGFILINIKRRLGIYEEPPLAFESKQVRADPLTAGLVVIGVLPSLQGKGIGSLLQQEFERKAISMGAHQLSLSVRTKNRKAIHSYELNGYITLRSEGPSYIMVKEI